ncbi:Intraflagellar transport protein 22 [Physocladia obscura]|uniref:Intraflagellar transport protein 22 n=1 Tax=Physocladia obscura TaxID=109957 RepID=A0AAD5T5T6_9FUNG|nr:Intraflagellar transport protein 22 [Physocladia obscura]
MSVQKLSVFVVGPQKTGKTTIANYLADLADSLNGNEYHPTQGVRILEFDRRLNNTKGKDLQISVEVWDCSGDPVYLPVWPAVSSSAAAVILVCTPEKKSEKDLEDWLSIFSFLNPVTQIIGVQSGISAKSVKPKFGKVLSKIPVYFPNLLDDNDTSRADFDALLYSAYNAFNENRDREEQLVLNH